MIDLLIVEDNERLQTALRSGLGALDRVRVVHACDSGEGALEYTLETPSGQIPPNIILMDVQLAGEMNGIEAAVAIRRELPRFPVIFYSIQDDDAYFRAFLEARVLSHYAYVRKSNYLLPQMIAPLLHSAMQGSGFIDPDIEARVHEVRLKDKNDPMSFLEPNEQAVARLLAKGLTNEQIAARMGFKDKRTISRVNGQIYAAWGLKDTATDEKIARTRAVVILQQGRLINWNTDGKPYVFDARGNQVDFDDW